jgi:homoserine O-acetyltransferase
MGWLPRLRHAALACVVGLASATAMAADYPAPRSADWVAREFKFHTGEVMPEVKLHYVTVGEPTGQPVLVLHGSGQSAAAMLTPAFAGELFGPGQPLDAKKYYIIIPDGLGHGKSTKPSDGLRAKFPQYDYDDMVEAQHRLVTEGLHAWLWGEKYPGLMDALVPMASQPTAMASRNWLMRRMIIDSVRNDPEWQGGNYTTQPHAFKVAATYFGIATSGGTLAYQAQAPTRAAADKLLAERLAQPFDADANDFMYAWASSGDYDAAPGLSHITARLLVINSADDERNPPETGVTENAVKQVKGGQIYLIPASIETRGHGTTAMAKFYTKPLAQLLQDAPAIR